MMDHINSAAFIWLKWMGNMFWQVGLLIILIMIIDMAIRRRAWPHVRYVLWGMVFIKLLIPPTWHMPTGIVSSIQPTVSEHIPVQIEHNVFFGISTPASGITEPEQNQDAKPAAAKKVTWQAALFLIWIGGMLFFALMLAVQLSRLPKRSQRRHARKAPEWFDAVLNSASRRLRLKKTPSVIFSRNAKSPAVYGLFRPVLVLPWEYFKDLTREQAEHVLLHELCHIKRGDLWVHWFCIVLQIVYWFNPLLILARRQMRHISEICCDLSVAYVLREKTAAYRETLLSTSRKLLADAAEPGIGLLGIFEEPFRIVSRLKWLDKKTWEHRKRKIAATIVAILIMVGFVMPMAGHSQPPETNKVRSGQTYLTRSHKHHLTEDDPEAHVVLIKLAMESGSIEEVDRPIMLRSSDPPPPSEYPSAAASNNIEGHVVVRFVVDTDGKGKDPEVVEADPEGIFEESALTIIEQHPFTPATLDGEPVPCTVIMTVEYTVESNEVRSGKMENPDGVSEFPETEEDLRAIIVPQLENLFGSLFEGLKLPQEKVEAFKELLIDESIVQNDILREIQGDTPEMTQEEKDELSQRIAEVVTEYDRKIAELIGDEAYSEFITYRDSLFERQLLIMLNNNQPEEEMIVAAKQVEKLVPVMYEARIKVVGKDTAFQNISVENSAAVIGAYIDSAKPILSEAQLENLQRLLLSFYNQDTSEASSPPPNLPTSKVQIRFIENTVCGRLLVITGEVQNRSTDYQKHLRVLATLYSKDGIAINRVTVYCGNVISDSELADASMDQILDKLNNKNGDGMSNSSIPPDGEVPFMAVFSNLQGNMVEFTVAALSDNETYREVEPNQEQLGPETSPLGSGYKSYLDNLYSGLSEALDLSLEVRKAFIDILVDRTAAIKELRSGIISASTQDQKADLQQRSDEIIEKQNSEIMDLLGYTGYEKYLAYEDKVVSINLVNNFMHSLNADEELTEEEAQDLVEILYQAQQNVFSEIGYDPREKTEFPSDLDDNNISEIIRQIGMIRTQSVEGARDILSTSQLKEFENYLINFSQNYDTRLIMKRQQFEEL